MKIILVFAGIAYLLTPIIAYLAGRRAAVNSNIRATLAAIGLTKASANHYQDAMKLLNAMIHATDLDGPYIGNVLTEATEREASRLVNEYRKELDLR